MIKKSKLIFITGAVIIAVSLILVAFLVVLTSGLSSSKTKLVFLSGSQEKVYDGTPLTCDEWVRVSGELKDGHQAVPTLNASRMDCGVSANNFTVKIIDSGGKDATGGYDIECRSGELKVTALPVSIQTDSGIKIYDGTPLTCDKYKTIKGELLPSHSLTVETTGTRTDAGISDNTFTAVVTDQNNKDVTQNYGIEKLLGKLEVIKREITISTASYHGVYDGNEVTRDEWQYASETRVVEGHKIEVIIAGTQTDAGVSQNHVGEVKVTDGDRDVSFNYSFKYILGDLIVTPRDITIRSASAKKEYDGQPLTRNTGDDWKIVSQTRLVDTHEIIVIITGERIEPGESPNTIAEVIILSQSGKEVTFNYSIRREEGSLIVYTGDPDADTGSSGDGGTDLDESGNIGGDSLLSGERELALSVNSAIGGQIYLRYMSFGDYYYSGWSNAAPYSGRLDSKYSLNYLTGIALKNAGYYSVPVSIEVYGNNYLLPYYLDTDEFSYRTQSDDVKHSGSTVRPYSAYYYLFSYTEKGLSAPELGKYAAAEAAYYEYVKNNYLAVPGDTKNFLLQLIAQKGFDKNTPDIIAQVAQYIKTAGNYNAKYDKNIDTGDAVVNFLRDGKEGVCRHFASAAVLLYRALGIPARYTIGYAGNVNKDEWIDFYTDNAHAWAEVYIGGLGWVQVEATPDIPAFDDGNTGGGAQQGMKIKPVDVSMKYQSGAVLYAPQELQGLAALIAAGYSYKTTVTGSRASIGIGYSTITAFTLYDPLGRDVTADYKFVFAKGKLHVYVVELTLTTKSLTKVYDGLALSSPANDFVLGGMLINGHSSQIKVTGRQTEAGQSENLCDVLILDAAGQDATYMYKVNRDYGLLTVEVRTITVTARSASKIFDPLDPSPLTCDEYDVSSEDFDPPLGDGDKIIVVCSGSQTVIGRSDNRIESVTILNKNGKDVTGSYSVKYVNGRLEVRR